MIEFGLIAGATGAAMAALKKSSDQEEAEQRAAQELYQRYFQASLLERAAECATTTGVIPAGLDAHAASCIRVIEKYQEQRRTTVMGISFRKSNTSDTRTRILEEMKQWCLTVSAESMPSVEVSTRLEYCRQLMLRPSLFVSTSNPSFLDTVVEVCRELERLLRRAMAHERSGTEKLERVLRVGREICQATVPVLLFSLPAEAALPERATAGADGVPPLLGPGVFDAAMGSASGEPPTSTMKTTDARSVLEALLGCEHVQKLGASDQEVAQENPAGTAASSRGSAAAFSSALRAARERWGQDQVGLESGLLPGFRTARHKESRQAYLATCAQLDTAAFFLSALRPYHDLAGRAGDVVLCSLRKSLVHLIQELERALAQLRQARLEVARAAKRELQEVAKRRPGVSSEEVRWMKGLRHMMQDALLDGLHRELAERCLQVRAATERAREEELHGAAKKGLKEIVASFMSADFQGRCSLRQPEGLATDMRQMALSVDAAAGDTVRVAMPAIMG